MEPAEEKKLVIEPNFVEAPSELNVVPGPGGSVMKGGAMQSPNFSKGRSGWKIGADGNAEFNNAEIRGTIVIGGQYRTVAVGDSIQDAIDAVYAAGGGTVVVQNGTHTLTSNLTLYSYVTLQGQNADAAILDFVNNAYGVVMAGSNAYSTGTVTVSNNGTAVTGSGTTWSTNLVAGMYILLGGLWYPIAAVGGDTSLTLGLAYAGVGLSGATYVAAAIINDAKTINLSIKNASAGIAFQYANELVIRDVNIQTSATAIDGADAAQVQFDQVDMVANNTGLDLNNVHFTKAGELGCVGSLVGHGIVLVGVTNSAFQACFSLNNAGDGANLTDCSNINIYGAFIENGGQGIEFVSGNSDISISGGAYENNGSDGIKLTATTDNLQIIGNSIKSNGAYGVNVAAATCDTNLILGNNFNGNATAAANNSGTGTLIRSNIGLADN